VGVRYRAGVEGIDVGGDWCDIVELGPCRVLLVVGDVSGRGLDTATTMASLHYSIRAYAREGDSPSTILSKLSKLVRLESDRQFASVLCGIVDVVGHRLTLANAGHLPPLVVADGHRQFVTTDTGAPIGVDDGRPYRETTIEVPPRSTVLAFTDGLVERRGETLDEGMDRLRITVPSAPASLDRCLDELVDKMLTPASHDDTAILGVRWTT
jgi:serine phosphatase RsbU (regulator of sigma subunit)